MEFPVSREARRRYALEISLLSPRGTAVFETVQAARDLAAKLNRAREQARPPGGAIRAGQLNALGLIEEIFRHVISLYRQTKSPNATTDAIAWLYARSGRESVDLAQRAFTEEFPPPPVFRGEAAAAAFLDGTTDGLSNRALVQEEMLLLWLANENPAYAPFLDLFDHAPLEARTGYARLIQSVREFFEAQPPFGPEEQNLVEMLRSPMLASPHSLYGQLEYIWSRWGSLLGRYEHVYRLLRGLDLIREEESVRFHGPGLSRPYDFTPMAGEAEHFSPDLDWMPRLVLVAKNVHVWLAQLSKAHGRSISRLDEIPDEDLARLARWGMTGLWLIGLWERSPASQTIKQMRGNPEAVASAYSLFEYRIAGDLGGEEAFANFKDRAWRHGVRLASDMVPNHMGIDSPWVIDHPERFLSLGRSPFPVYTFKGPDLSWNASVGIYLEDHYFDSTDAAVVFKRVDRRTGAERYVYHGNDGTSTPWNDTAQIDYLNPEAREAVIQSILHVARLFPVIRFDAAMTLAKRHFQRLWFPEPGTGGAIPSRSEHGMTKEQFDAAMPEEFWREVVDRVAREVPNTLLLAEAFWLMEGYFVRTLGMHRVYNSAFMNMMRDEDNANYRSVIKNTLEFDPEILKRYVNFMNNPDEKTAVEQFGKGDKYFGIAMLMATLPGLPMFGHGQVEGLEEKYGMEFRRPRRDESPDPDLVAHHEREIFPLLHRRKLFAEVRNFLLYDVFDESGSVNEDVFAFSNRDGEDRALVVYHNRFASARGWIRTSVAFDPKSGTGRTLVQRTLGEGLGVEGGGDAWVLFRDRMSGLEYLRNGREIHTQGLFLELPAYGRRLFTDFREVREDARGRYRALAAHLAGRGVPSLEQAWRELFLRSVHEALGDLVSEDVVGRLAALAERRRESPIGPGGGPGVTPSRDENDEVAAGEASPASLAGSSVTERTSGDDPTVDAPPVTGAEIGPDLAESLRHSGGRAPRGSRATAGPLATRASEEALLDEIERKTARFAEAVRSYTEGAGDAAAVARTVRRDTEAALVLRTTLREPAACPGRGERDAAGPSKDRSGRRERGTIPDASAGGEPSANRGADSIGKEDRSSRPDADAIDEGGRTERGDAESVGVVLGAIAWDGADWGLLLGWSALRALGTISGEPDAAAVSRRWLDELLLLRGLEDALRGIGLDPDRAARALVIVRVLIERQAALSGPAPSHLDVRALVRSLLFDEDVRRSLGVNRHDEVLWYRKESFEDLLAWIGLAASVVAKRTEASPAPPDSREDVERSIPPPRAPGMLSSTLAWFTALVEIRSISDASGYRLARLEDALLDPSSPSEDRSRSS